MILNKQINQTMTLSRKALIWVCKGDLTNTKKYGNGCGIFQVMWTTKRRGNSKDRFLGRCSTCKKTSALNPEAKNMILWLDDRLKAKEYAKELNSSFLKRLKLTEEPNLDSKFFLKPNEIQNVVSVIKKVVMDNESEFYSIDKMDGFQKKDLLLLKQEIHSLKRKNTSMREKIEIEKKKILLLKNKNKVYENFIATLMNRGGD